MKRLEWGLDLRHETAWGCRAIFHGKVVDVVRDRRSWRGDIEGLAMLLGKKGGPLDQACTKASVVCKPHMAERIVLYEDENVVVVGNTNGSHGYLYVGAGLKTPCQE